MTVIVTKYGTHAIGRLTVSRIVKMITLLALCCPGSDACPESNVFNFDKIKQMNLKEIK